MFGRSAHEAAAAASSTRVDSSLVARFERSIRDWPLRRKIWLLPIVAGAALLTIVLVTTSLGLVNHFQLLKLEDQGFHSLQQTARLRTILDELQAALRSAVARHEADRLIGADSLRGEFLATLSKLQTIAPRDAGRFAALDRSFREYYTRARATCLLLLDGQSGDSVDVAMDSMVHMYGGVSQRVDDAHQHDERAITAAFHKTLVFRRVIWIADGLVTVLCLLLLRVIAIALTRALTDSLNVAIRIADQVAAGNMRVQIPKASDDEVGQLLHAMRAMVAYLGGMSRIANRIAQGDTSVDLGNPSEHDQLGVAFAAMVSYLDQMAVVAERLGDGDLMVTITPRSERDRFSHAFANTLDRLTASIGGLRESEARLLLALEVADVRIWEWDLDADQITGLVSDPSGGNAPMSAATLVAQLHPNDRTMVAAAFARVRRTHGDFEISFRTNQPDEPTRWLSTRARTVRDGAATGARVMGAAHDVTARKHAEDALRRQALVFETISDSVLVVGADDRILDTNRASTAIFGYARDEMVGMTRLVWEAADPERRLAIDQSLRANGKWEGELPLLRKDGRTGIVHTVIQSFYDQRGDHVANIAVSRDLTEHRQLEQQLVQAQKLEAIGSLAAGIAHEINTPAQYVRDNVGFLADTVRAFATLRLHMRALVDAARSHNALAPLIADVEAYEQSLDIDFLTAEWPAAAEHARDGVERIAEIVRAMRDFSHQGAIAKVDTDLNAAIRNTVIVCRNEWKYVAALTLDLDEHLPPITCIPGEVQQVILNLVVNAAHAIATLPADGQSMRGTIVVSTQRDDGWAEIRVRDNGPGIPASIRDRIFDPFFTTKDVGKGTGQGLSLAYNTIAVKHAGSITVESTEGQGATFIVRLPLNLDPLAAGAVELLASSGI